MERSLSRGLTGAVVCGGGWRLFGLLFQGVEFELGNVALADVGKLLAEVTFCLCTVRP